MKKILAFALLVAFAVQCFNNAFIVLSFYANQKDIASRLCENRYKPMLHCNGKCQLAKKIRQEENKDRQDPERKIENKNEIISSKSFFVTATHFVEGKKYNYISVSGGKIAGHNPDIFHPPCA